LFEGDTLKPNSRPHRREPGVLETAQTFPVHKWLLVLVAAAYVGYLGLLITCDALRVEPHGIVPEFRSDAVLVQGVEAGSAAERTGLLPHDQLLRVNGQELLGAVDWQWLRVHLDPARPLEVEMKRRGRAMHVSIPLSAGLHLWSIGSSRPGLIAFRLVQVVTLGFALLVAFSRPSQLSALLGAWLLASFATVSLVLPVRMFHFWQSLPQPIEALLWLPHTTSAALGPLLFAFFAVFPRRTLSPGALLIALFPGGIGAAWLAYVGSQLWQEPGASIQLPDLTTVIFFLGVVYALGAAVLLVLHYREAESVTDRRRIRLLLGGLSLAVLAGASLLVLYQFSSGDIFGNPLLTVLALFFLAGPASFADAILRHRLFGLRLMVRQGVQ
jgi:hypothetical protein